MNQKELKKVSKTLKQWILEDCDDKENKGIVNMHYGYIETNSNQDKYTEYEKIENFLHKYMEHFHQISSIQLIHLARNHSLLLFHYHLHQLEVQHV